LNLPTAVGTLRVYGAGMWRLAIESDDDVLADMCPELYREDPGPLRSDARHMRETLATLRREPWRGRAVVLEVGLQVVGYALLIAYWSNEFGGEVCAVDELYVSREFRSRGYGAALFEAIEGGAIWPAPLVAVALGITRGNTRARRLYERLGFAGVGVSMIKTYRSPRFVTARRLSARPLRSSSHAARSTVAPGSRPKRRKATTMPRHLHGKGEVSPRGRRLRHGR